ncbi:hypothetical protein [Brasilonema bromeliae]|uniref:Uncharacterized protein n=1 Tax=Brasilonema bromeliae SPC951 TaxID=385972 RepID=A0ABX1P1N0_9CYAN|nr:hypothetical protein [Brasilonema bromeliae]NMG18209.1 hypothetical protein [Brasilonema bromeliae SPC951]
MKNSPQDLVAVEDLLIAVQITDTDDIVIVQGEAIVDLAEFNLTPQEVDKFEKILKTINGRLAESFQKQFPATSVISEIRKKSQCADAST